MEVLTLLIRKKVATSSVFKYYVKCDKLGIVNLCFANDLFLFAHGDLGSAKVLHSALNEFKVVSGLVPSRPGSSPRQPRLGPRASYFIGLQF